MSEFQEQRIIVSGFIPESFSDGPRKAPGHALGILATMAGVPRENVVNLQRQPRRQVVTRLRAMPQYVARVPIGYVEPMIVDLAAQPETTPTGLVLIDSEQNRSIDVRRRRSAYLEEARATADENGIACYEFDSGWQLQVAMAKALSNTLDTRP